MQIIIYALSIFGFGWLLLILFIGLFGGRFLIQLKNPITQEMESITDVILEGKIKRKY